MSDALIDVWLVVAINRSGYPVSLWSEMPDSRSGGPHLGLSAAEHDAREAAALLPDYRMTIVHARVPRPVAQPAAETITGEIVG
ncbi:hypothetical protein P7L78_22095 [Tistrella bauzanensis]|uniref:hypothetical protein n=1 Tax=Tistrella TaxID=171436 RepID=UPI0031F68AC8